MAFLKKCWLIYSTFLFISWGGGVGGDRIVGGRKGRAEMFSAWGV